MCLLTCIMQVECLTGAVGSHGVGGMSQECHSALWLGLFRRNQARAQEQEMYAKAKETRKAETPAAATAAHAPVSPEVGPLPVMRGDHFLSQASNSLTQPEVSKDCQASMAFGALCQAAVATGYHAGE